MSIRLLDYNYVVNIDATRKAFIVKDNTSEDSDIQKYEIPFGSLLCERLNKQYDEEHRKYPEWAKPIYEPTGALAELKKIGRVIRGDKLFESILTDREQFAQNLHELSVISSNHANVRWYYDVKSGKTVSQCGVSDLEDLLILDCCKVLEHNIHIAQCPICKRFICSTRPIKYCERDKARATKDAKRARYKNDEVLRMKKQIYDRLRVNDNWYNMKHNDFRDTAGEFSNAFRQNQTEMDRETLLEWLMMQDEATRKRKAALGNKPKAAKGKEDMNNGEQ